MGTIELSRGISAEIDKALDEIEKMPDDLPQGETGHGETALPNSTPVTETVVKAETPEPKEESIEELRERARRAEAAAQTAQGILSKRDREEKEGYERRIAEEQRARQDLEARLAQLEADKQKSADGPPLPSAAEMMATLRTDGWTPEWEETMGKVNAAETKRIAEEVAASVRAEIEPVKEASRRQEQNDAKRQSDAYFSQIKTIPDFFDVTATPEFQAKANEIYPGGFEELRAYHDSQNFPAVKQIFTNIVNLISANGKDAAKTAAKEELNKTMASQSQPSTRQTSGSSVTDATKRTPDGKKIWKGSEYEAICDEIYNENPNKIAAMSEADQQKHWEERTTLMRELKNAALELRIDTSM